MSTMSIFLKKRVDAESYDFEFELPEDFEVIVFIFTFYMFCLFIEVCFDFSGVYNFYEVIIVGIANDLAKRTSWS